MATTVGSGGSVPLGVLSGALQRCLRIVAPEDGETGASIPSSGPSLMGLACRDIAGVHLLADEHPSAAQEKAGCRDPSAHVQCGILALVHGTVHQARWPEGCDTIHHRYLPHPHPLSVSQPRRTFQNTNLLSKHSLNSYPQWFPIAHRKKTTTLTMALDCLALPIVSISYTILIQSLLFSQTGIVSFSPKSTRPLHK